MPFILMKMLRQLHNLIENVTLCNTCNCYTPPETAGHGSGWLRRFYFHFVKTKIRFCVVKQKYPTQPLALKGRGEVRSLRNKTIRHGEYQRMVVSSLACPSFGSAVVPSLKSLAIDAISYIISLVRCPTRAALWKIASMFHWILAIRLKKWRDSGTLLVNMDMIAFKSKLIVPKVSHRGTVRKMQKAAQGLTIKLIYRIFDKYKSAL